MDMSLSELRELVMDREESEMTERLNWPELRNDKLCVSYFGGYSDYFNVNTCQSV